MTNNLMNLLTLLDKIPSPLVFSTDADYIGSTIVISLKSNLIIACSTQDWTLLQGDQDTFNSYLIQYNIKNTYFIIILGQIKTAFLQLTEEELFSYRERNFSKNTNNSWQSFMNNNKTKFELAEARELFLV